jgi:signal transduction histidine kinase
MARRIFQEAQRLGQRVDDVLAVVRERSIPQPVAFDPEEPLMEAVERWGPRLDDAGVELHVDVDVAPQVLGDASAVRDAVGCLLDNALKYRREDRPDPTVWLNLKADGRDAIIEVIDNGIGVPTGMRKRIFDKFVRVEGPNRGMAGGHGLGLAQVAEVARLHRGRVDCSDGIEGGSRFVLRLRGGT